MNVKLFDVTVADKMIQSSQLVTPARCLVRALSPRSTPLLLKQLQQRTLIDARRIASPQSMVQVDRLADYVRDEQITTSTVRIKNADGLGQPQDIQRVLRNIDRRTHTLVQLDKIDSDNMAVVQIYEKTDLLKQVREKEERARAQQLATKDKKPKQLELNWAISENDLELKLRQLETFLEKGKKVEVLLAAKKRQRKASQDEGDTVLRKVRQKIRDVGAKEIKVMQGQVLKQATLIVQK